MFNQQAQDSEGEPESSQSNANFDQVFKQKTPGSEGQPESSQPNAYFEEISGLRERYDSHILPADYKYKVGTFPFDVFNIKYLIIVYFLLFILDLAGLINFNRLMNMISR